MFFLFVRREESVLFLEDDLFRGSYGRWALGERSCRRFLGVVIYSSVGVLVLNSVFRSGVVCVVVDGLGMRKRRRCVGVFVRIEVFR